MINMRFKINGIELGVLKNGLMVGLEQYPVITLPRSTWDKIEMPEKYLPHYVPSDTTVGDMTLNINVICNPQFGTSEGLTRFDYEVVDMLNRQPLHEIEFDSKPGLVYICRLNKGIRVTNLAKREFQFSYEIGLDIERVEKKY